MILPSGGTLKKLVCILLALILCASILIINCAHASTSATGIINSDTTWDTAHGPYQLTGPVLIQTNVTLTIMPGVTVDFAGYYIEVNGTLIAEGTSNNKIDFTSSVNSAKSQNYPFQVISFDPAGSGTISNAQFNIISVFISGGSPTISYNTFNNPGTTTIDIFDSSPTVSNNVVNSGSTGVNGIVAHSNPTVSNNTVIGGMYGIYATGSANLYNNTVIGGEISVSIALQVNFVGNTVMDGTGVSSSTSRVIQRN